MITITERPCTPSDIEEKNRLIEYLRNDSGLSDVGCVAIAIILFIGCFIALIFFRLFIAIANYFQFIGYGFAMLLFGILFITFFSAPLFLFYKRKLNRLKQQELAVHYRDLENSRIESINITHIREYWEISNQDCLCCMSGYLFRTEENEYFSFISDDLLEFYAEEDEEFENPIFPETITIEKWLPSGNEKSIRPGEGDPVPRSGYISINYLLDTKDEEKCTEFLSGTYHRFENDLGEITRKHATADYKSSFTL